MAPDSDHLSVNLVSGIEQHFSAHATPRGFVHHAIRAGTLPRRALQHAVLFRHFFSRELESRFQGTVLGPAWVLVHPVFLFLVYFAVFGFGLRDTMGHQDLSLFAVYLFSGIEQAEVLVTSACSRSTCSPASSASTGSRPARTRR